MEFIWLIAAMCTAVLGYEFQSRWRRELSSVAAHERLIDDLNSGRIKFPRAPSGVVKCR